MSIEIINYEANAGFGIIFPSKTFIIEEENQITVISPCDLSQEKIEQLKASKKQIIFIAPNNFHNLYLKKMQQTFPKAEFFGPKRSAKQSGVELKKTTEYTSSILEMYPLNGNPGIGETCFYHKELKTLIVTDLFFNMKHKMNFATKMAMKCAGTYHKTATSRAVKITTKDKAAFNTSLTAMGKLDLESIIPSHGGTLTRTEFKEFINHSI